jgi:hypothetical protein
MDNMVDPWSHQLLALGFVFGGIAWGALGSMLSMLEYDAQDLVAAAELQHSSA